MIHFFFLASLTVFLSRGLHQYGLLQAGHVFGNTDLPDSSSRGHHLCPQRVHSNCSTVTFLPNEFMFIMSLYYLAYILSGVNNIYPAPYNTGMKMNQLTTKQGCHGCPEPTGTKRIMCSDKQTELCIDCYMEVGF